MESAQRIGKSMFIGALSGLAAAWVMNQYWAAESKLKQQLQREENTSDQQLQRQHEPENPTVEVAQAVSRNLSGHDLPDRCKQQAGAAVHYIFGASMGAFYGLLSEVAPMSRTGFGLVYAAALWLTADEIMVPALGLSKAPNQYPLSKHLEGLGAHMVYGATTEGLRRALQRAA
jgi:putative membrane protein